MGRRFAVENRESFLTFLLFFFFLFFFQPTVFKLLHVSEKKIRNSGVER